MSRPVVALTRLAEYSPAAVDAAVGRLVDALGGSSRFFPEGGRVVLKPNLLAPTPVEKHTCTHPEIIRAVARLARRGGAGSVEVTDSPAVTSARGCLKRLGYGDGEPAGVVELDEVDEITPPGSRFHGLRIGRRLLEADAVINLAKLKTHGQMTLTAAVKNTFGAVVGLEKAQWHFRAGVEPARFAELLIDVHRLVGPRLSIVDAVIGQEGNGPNSGVPRHLGFLAASDDGFALDRVLCHVLDLDPGRVPTVALAARLGLAPDLDGIAVVGDDPLDLRPIPPLRLASPGDVSTMGLPRPLAKLTRRLIGVRPGIEPRRCTACGQCVRSCAAQALRLDPGSGGAKPRLLLDLDRCISCFCCQEICPEGAIAVATGPLAGLVRSRNR